ncbi:MAG TPA: ABC transporter permease [Microvirga sp.]|jgi:putative spermidine/putrescine transport system permease protein
MAQDDEAGTGVPASRRRGNRRSVGQPGLLLVAPALVLIVLFFVVPAAQVFVTAVWGGDGFTLTHLHRAVAEPVYGRVLWRTVEISLIATLACLLVGYPVAYYLAQQPERTRQRLLFLVLVPFWMSILVRSFAWMAVLGRQGPVNGFLQWTGLTDAPVQLLFTTGAVALAMVQILLPFMILTCLNVMLAIDPNLTRAARAHGATPLTAFLRVFLPLSAPGVMAGAVLVLILAMGFFVTPLLLGGPRNQMLGNLIVTQIGDTVNWGFAAALALLLLLATLVLIPLTRLVVGRGAGSTGRVAP